MDAASRWADRLGDSRLSLLYPHLHSRTFAMLYLLWTGDAPAAALAATACKVWCRWCTWHVCMWNMHGHGMVRVAWDTASQRAYS